MTWGERPLMSTGLKFGFLFNILILCNYVMLAQETDVHVRAGFLTDSIKIGEQTGFYLAAHYPEKLTILFPDSAYNFAPFEYQRKKYFATKTEGGVSTDSAVYFLTTFEVDRLQNLQLPVFVVQAKDCTVFQSPRDSLWITQLVAKVPDSLSAEKLPLKMNTAYQKVFFEFNFLVLVIVIFVLLIVALLIWVFFGKKISRYFMMKKLSKNHSRFVHSYNQVLQQVQATWSVISAESAVSIWKKYMEQLETAPYTKLTTRELLRLMKDEALANNLRTIDTAIYGHEKVMLPALEHLKSFADQRFTKKLEELKHG